MAQNRFCFTPNTSSHKIFPNHWERRKMFPFLTTISLNKHVSSEPKLVLFNTRANWFESMIHTKKLYQSDYNVPIRVIGRPHFESHFHTQTILYTCFFFFPFVSELMIGLRCDIFLGFVAAVIWLMHSFQLILMVYFLHFLNFHWLLKSISWVWLSFVVLLSLVNSYREVLLNIVVSCLFVFFCSLLLLQIVN